METSGPEAGSRPRRRRRTLVCGTILLSLAPFVLLEVGLRVLAVGENAVDLHDGFGTANALFVLDSSDQIWRTNIARQRFFVGQEFPASKPADEFRIFCLGGSTVQGRPYEPDTSFGKWLELELAAEDPQHRYRAVNCGGISYASYRLQSVMEEVLTHEPDLVVLATGHNEFLEDQTYSNLKSRSSLRMKVEEAAKSLRTVMVLRELTGGAARAEPKTTDAPSQSVEARLDTQSGYAAYQRDEEWRSSVRQHYRESLQQMIEVCQSANIPLVLVRLGANLRDCPPFKSAHASGLATEEQARWQELFDEAGRVEIKDPAAALKLYGEAKTIDNRHALLHFRIARCQDQLGDYDAAALAYRSALDEDICPLRMLPAIAQELQDVATLANVPLVDAEAAIAARSPQSLPGYDAYIDHVHPTVGSHQIIASAIKDALIDRGLFHPVQPTTALAIRDVRQKHLVSLSPAYFSNGRRRIGWLEKWARRQRLDREILAVNGRGFMAAALRCIDLHDFTPAAENLLMATAMDDQIAGSFVASAAALYGQGRPDAAAWIIAELRNCDCQAATERTMDLAEIVIAISNDDRPWAVKIHKRHDDWTAIVSTDQSGWSQQMPDVGQRISELP